MTSGEQFLLILIGAAFLNLMVGVETATLLHWRSLRRASVAVSRGPQKEA
jgi:hypothetical protein